MCAAPHPQLDGYNAAVANIDFHTHAKPDSLIVFAASNDGQRWGYGSIQPEAQAKNVLSVGATRTSSQVRGHAFCSVCPRLMGSRWAAGF